MPQMILCKYCGRPNEITQLVCVSCGASLPHGASEPASAQDLAEKLLKLCHRYEDVTQFYTEGAIPEKKLFNARPAFAIPPDERILMLCDSTVFGSSKTGFAICASGIYWNNDWATPTKRKKLTWAEFAERQPYLETFDIDLGRGDKINLSALGGRQPRLQALKLLEDLRLEYVTHKDNL